MRFEEHVERAVASLPPELRDAVRNVEISVEDEHPDDPDLLGLYQGGDYGPDTVTIYRRPLEETFHDPAELERVYGSLRVLPERSDDPPQDADAFRNDAAERELAAVREMLERERSMYERDRRAWEEERSYMRSLVDRHTEQIKLLTDQRERTSERRSWFARWRQRRVTDHAARDASSPSIGRAS